MKLKLATPAEPASPDTLRRLRSFIHRKLVDDLDGMSQSGLPGSEEIRRQLKDIMDELQNQQRLTLSRPQSQQLEQEILEELGGMGPLAPLMLDTEISDILVNGADEVWIDRHGKLEKTDIAFDDDAHLRRFLDRIISQQGRHLDASNPMVDAKLQDGSRLHAVIPPLCNQGAVVSIRRFRLDKVGPEELVSNGFLSQAMLELLQLAVKAGMNIVIAGSAAAGKTTLLNALSRSIPANQRIVSIEETTELRLEHPHTISLEARPVNMEGRGGVSLRELVRNALRMRADRIIVGEVRGSEVMDMLQAMNVGHEGSLTTVHANSIHDVLRRLESLALMSNADIPRETVREMIASSIQLVVHATRFQDGSRRITSIGEVVFDQGNLKVKPLYEFCLQGKPGDPVVRGEHCRSAHPAEFLEQIQLRGHYIPAHLLQERRHATHQLA